METTDLLIIIYGCTILITNYKKESYKLLGFNKGEILFHIESGVLLLDSVSYSKKTDLDQMLEALSRFSALAHVNGILCDATIPLPVIAYLDSNGILDRDYTINE